MTLDYAELTAGSAAALQAARARLPGGHTRQTLVFPPHPFFAARGEGAYLTDVDGRRYLDFVNNYTSLVHGHAHAPTVAAIAEAAARGGAPGAPTALELRMADVLARRIPSLERLRFAVTGSEAVGYALRVARAHTGRARVLKFEGGFHGSWDAVQQSIRSEPMAPGAFCEGRPNSGGLPPVGTIVARYNDLDSVRAALARWGEEVAAVIVEPFLGNGALVAAEPGFLAAVQELAHAHGALFVLDEIQSCRLALGGAQSLHGVRPDLTTVGKTIGGGLPLAAFGGREELMAHMDGLDPDVPQPGTFNAFPLSLSAGLATLAEWDAPAVARLGALGEQARERIRATFAARGVPVSVGGSGSMFHVALREEPIACYADIAGADAAGWQLLHQQLLARGVYTTARGTGCLSTPMTEADLDVLAEALDAALAVLCERRPELVA
ncbi:MAG TPA: aminotransferase class III-fold pyridoxal phosphate-dependent enzyme [Conexibacter sp.]|nr:aminotransferase class III-fold pyridoxal phosphate-dependent enzyme [Conexibacter sp.]